MNAAWRPTTLLEWMMVITAVLFVVLVIAGFPDVLRECGKPITEMPGWCLMIVGPK